VFKELKYIILVVSVLSVQLSCKKDDDDIPVGTFSAILDGTKISFYQATEADISNLTGAHSLYIRGYSDHPSVSQTSLWISVINDSLFARGTYIENSLNRPLVQLTYELDLGNGNFFQAYSLGNNTGPVTVVLTEVNSAFVKGTFSGELQGTRNGAQVKIAVEDGKFHLRL
jgi:hypothetical protein